MNKLKTFGHLWPGSGPRPRFEAVLYALARRVQPFSSRKRRSPQEARGCSRPDLPRAADAVFEGGELLDPHGPSRMHAAGRDADLGAETEFTAIGELRRGIVQDDRRMTSDRKRWRPTDLPSRLTAQK